MQVRSYMRMKYLLYMMIPTSILIVLVVLFRQDTLILTIFTFIFIAVLLVNYLIRFSARFFVYQGYLLIQVYFSKRKVNYDEIQSVHEKEQAIEFVFKDTTRVTYRLNGFLKQHQKQLFIDLSRKISKDIIL